MLGESRQCLPKCIFPSQVEKQAPFGTFGHLYILYVSSSSRGLSLYTYLPLSIYRGVWSSKRPNDQNPFWLGQMLLEGACRRVPTAQPSSVRGARALTSGVSHGGIGRARTRVCVPRVRSARRGAREGELAWGAFGRWSRRPAPSQEQFWTTWCIWRVESPPGGSR